MERREEGTTPVPLRDPDSGDDNQAPSTGGEQPRPSDVNTNPNNNFANTLQEALEEAKRIQAKVQELKNAPDNKSNEQDMVSSSREVRQGEKEVGDQISNLETPNPGLERLNDAYESYNDILESQYEDMVAREERRVKSIESDFAAQQADLEDEQDTEAAQTRSSLIRSGGYLGESASAVGVLRNLSKTHRSEVSALEAKKQTAITEAREAFADNQTEIATAMAQSAIDLESEIQNRRTEFFDQSLSIIQEKRQQESSQLLNEGRKLDNALTRAESIAPTLVSRLDMIDDPQLQDEIIQGYSEKYGIDRETLESQIKTQRAKELADALDNANTRSIMANRGSDGSDDDNSDAGALIKDYLEEYKSASDEELRTALLTAKDEGELDVGVSTINAYIDSRDKSQIERLNDDQITKTANAVFDKKLFRGRGKEIDQAKNAVDGLPSVTSRGEEIELSDADRKKIKDKIDELYEE